jgi:tetratricopeptide (TPR) repeat protein
LLDGESVDAERQKFVNLALRAQILREQALAEHDLDKLNDAVATIRVGIAQPATGRERRTLQTLLSVLLQERSTWLEGTGDLVEAIALAREVAEDTDADESQQRLALSHLDDLLSQRLEPDPDVLDELIDVRRRRDATLPAGSERATVRFELGAVLLRKFESTANPDLIEQAVDAFRAALEDNADDDAQVAAAQNGLAAALLRRYRAFGRGDRAELDEAVSLLREAAGLVPGEALSRADLLTNLAVALDLRWQAGAAADLAAADAAARQALEVSNGAGAAGARARRVLIGVVEEWYRQTGEPERFWEVVELLKDAAERVQTPDLGEAYANLSDLFWAGFKVDGGLGSGRHWDISRGRHGSIEKLDLAVTAIRSALDQPADDDDRSGRQATLGVLLRSRFQLTQRAEELAEAVHVGEEAVRAASSEGPRLSAQFSLADTLAVRYRAEQRSDDLATALATFRDLTDSPLLGTELRRGCAARWGHLAYLAGEPADGLGAYEIVINLLPRLVWRGLDAADRLRMLSTWSGVAHEAAACAISADQPDRALELLDQSRSILWGQRRELRSDLSEFAAAYPKDAARLSALATALDQAADLDTDIVRYGSIVTSADPRDRIALAHEWDALVESVKQREGFTDFLTPPSAGELRVGASGGSVVVINVSHLRCDAIAITTEETTVIPLPDLSMDELIEHVNAFNGPQSMTRDGESGDLCWRDLASTGGGPALDDTLGWMWRTIAEPVLTALGYHNRPADGAAWPHVWWCPTGWLTFLPLHAAGLHTTRDEARPATVLDRVVSSYTLNIGALSDARRREAWTEHPFAPLVISIAETPGAPDLEGAREERADLVNRYPGTRVLAEQGATRVAVLAALPVSPWIHLACHGTQDVADPTEGRLLLYDEPLRIRDISALQLTHAELAFVSACHTSRGGLSIPDDGMTVAGALQFAGYRHVIGTLWAIADNHAPEVARHVYAELDRAANRIDLADAGVALHHAVHMLRERFPNTPTIWAPYVHFGP